MTGRIGRFEARLRARHGRDRISVAARASFAIAVCLANLGCGEGDAPRPNLLLITMSSQELAPGMVRGPGLLECPDFGDATDERFACRLGARGARYRWAFTAATDPSPAIAALMTSLPGAGHHISRSAATFLRSETLTLAERLAQAGYATGGFTGRARLNRSRDLDQGFELYWVGQAEHDAGDPIRAAAAWIEVQSEDDERPWFAWIDIPSEPDPGAAVLLARLIDPERANDPEEPLGIIALGVPRGGLDGETELRGAPAELSLSHVRVPLFYSPPGGIPALEVVEAVSTVDVAPTLLRAAAIESPETFIGERLPTGPRPQEAPRARALIVEGRGSAAIVLGGRYYARFAPRSETNGVAIDDSEAGERAWTARLERSAFASLEPVGAGEGPTRACDLRLREALDWPEVGRAEGPLIADGDDAAVPRAPTPSDAPGKQATSPPAIRGSGLPPARKLLSAAEDIAPPAPAPVGAATREPQPIQALASPR